MSASLLRSRRFAPLFWCQFFAAFNDNFLKNALVLLTLFQIGGARGESLVTLAGAVFIAPYFVLSALGGQIADKFDKARVAQRLKLAEIGAAAVAVAGFLTASVPVLFGALFLFGALGALFGPVKYGILPDCLRLEELPAGNALVEGATFLAILTGTIAGGLAMRDGGDPSLSAVGVMAVAVASWSASLFIPAAPRGAPELEIDANVLRSTSRLLRELWSEARLWRLGVVTSVFWLVGIVAMSLLPTLVVRTLHGSQIMVTIYLTVFAVAIAAGSGLAAFLLSGAIVLLPTAIGAAIMALVSADLGVLLLLRAPSADAAQALAPAAFFAEPGVWRATIDLAVLAIAGGLMIVPSFAAIQAFAAPAKRARVVAAVNVLNSAFMAMGTLAVAVAQNAGVTVPALFLCIAGVALAASIWIFATVLTSPLRDLLSILFRAFYRLEVQGLVNVAKAGPNPIIAVDHVSFLDAALILAVLPKEPTFAVDRTIAQRRRAKPFLQLVRAIQLDLSRPLGVRESVRVVKAGNPLVVFLDGRLAGADSLKAHDCAGLIADKSGAMVVPARIEGPEATMFSRFGRERARRRWFPEFTLTFFEPVRVTVDDALKGKARRRAAGSALSDIMQDLVFRTAKGRTAQARLTPTAH